MEAINSLASVATKAIWGDSAKDPNPATANKDASDTTLPKEATQEPISGVQGDPSKGEPFDAGNIENVDAAAAGPKPTDTTTEATASAEQPSSHMKEDSTKHQSDVREPDATEPHHKEEEKKDVDNVEPLDESSLKGPGPRPLAELARERGGDAGNATTSAAAGPADQSSPATENKADDPNTNEAGEPLGQKHVVSTGVAADGGDFDAAKPGAGAEADRILHEKGIHPDTTAGKKSVSPDRKAASPDGNKSSSSPDRKGVKGLGRKIKEKLRRGSQS